MKLDFTVNEEDVKELITSLESVVDFFKKSLEQEEENVLITYDEFLERLINFVEVYPSGSWNMSRVEAYPRLLTMKDVLDEYSIIIDDEGNLYKCNPRAYYSDEELRNTNTIKMAYNKIINNTKERGEL